MGIARDTIAEAIAERMGKVEVLAPDNPKAALAGFTVPGQAKAVWGMIEADLKEPGVTDMTAKYGPRLVEKERCDYLRPMVVHCTSSDAATRARRPRSSGRAICKSS